MSKQTHSKRTNKSAIGVEAANTSLKNASAQAAALGVRQTVPDSMAPHERIFELGQLLARGIYRLKHEQFNDCLLYTSPSPRD